jgi:hypothetical protein
LTDDEIKKKNGFGAAMFAPIAPREKPLHKS